MTKAKLHDEQIHQLKNIAETLVEATEHFANNIKERQMTQSINIFSAIVEGFQAIQKTSVTHKIELDSTLITRIEKDLISIAQQLENNNMVHIAQAIQFSLLPKFKKMNEIFITSKTEQEISIGIYHDKANPKDLYPEARVAALNKEGQRQHAILLYFTSNNVDFKNKKIKAQIFKDNTWQEVESDFPNVINNTGTSNKHQQSITERKLRRIIPFTSFHVGNKFYLPKVMVQQRRFADLLVPFKMVQNKQIVYDYLEEEKIAVAKPILGARGERIYFIRRKGNRFTVTDHRQERIYNQEKFEEWLQNTLLRQKFSYMVQRYIDCHTKDNEPYDIRAHMQKNEKGAWQITKIYPRIGSKDSILSNISRGGRTENLKDFLTSQFGEQTGKTYDNKLRNLSIDLTEYLDRIHNFSLDELGLDLAIDETGRFWLHEANNGPQSTYHENERAVNTIGYAKYIATNGIVKQNQFSMDEGQFSAKKSTLPFAEVNNRYRIGMLKSEEENDKLAVACAYVANYENVQFYTFSPQDVDYNEMLIKGKFFEKGEWEEKIIEYPDVIYDRFRLRGINQFNNVYEELEGIPFTNEFYGNSISKLEVYDKLKSTGKLNDVIIPYKKVEKVRDIFDYIDEFAAVIVKPEVGSFARGVHYISKTNDNHFFVAEREKEQKYTEIELRKYFNELMEKSTFIVQQYIKSRTIDGHPFDIRVHMMKNEENEWEFVHKYPRIGLHYASIMSTDAGGYIGNLSGFLQRNYPNHSIKKVEKDIEQATLKIARMFGNFYEEHFNEIAFDIAIDEHANVQLIELNVNKPGIIYFEFDLARQAIPNAIFLAKQEANGKFEEKNQLF